MLDIPAQRTRAELRVIRGVDDQLLCSLRQLAVQLFVRKTLVERVNLQIDDARDVLFGERLIEDDLVEPVQKLGAEGVMEQAVNLVLCRLRDLAVGSDAVEQHLAAEVRGQDDDRIFEVYGSALRVCDSAVVEDLQQHVEHVRVRLFNLVKQNDRVRTAADRFGQLTAFLIAHVSGRCANQTRHGEFLHILRHVDADEVLLVVKQRRGKRFGELRFADAGRTQEQERAERTVRVLDTGSASLDCFGNDADCLVLPDDALVERIFQMQQLFALRFHQPRDRDTGPALDDLCNFFFRYLVAQQIRALGILRLLFILLELLFELRQVAIFELRSFFVLAVFLGSFDIAVQLLDLFTQLLDLTDCLFFVFPLRLHGVEALAVFGKLLLQLGKARLGKLVVLVFERCLFDLHLDNLAVDDVEFGRHRVHFGADHGASLVDEVDCLIGQEPVGDIAVTERCGGNDRGVRNLDAVEDLVSRFQTTQDCNRILNRRLLDQNGLEPALECRVLFDILPVFIERRCADAVQLAARQHRLEEVAGVHRAFGLARADNGMQLVDEEDDSAFGFLDLGQNSFQPLFKFAAVFCARNQAAHIQREDGLILQCLRHLAGDNPLRQTFDDCRLADARFADENGVVFRFPGQNADHVSDFLITTDDGVHLLLACALDKIGAVFLQRLIGVLRGIGGHALVAADGLQRLQKTLFCNVIGGEQAL